jgi:carboxyl-terminal processing protease
MKIKLKGEYGGLGISVNIKNDQLIVVSPMEDTPAWEKGIESMDKIIEINGLSTKGITLEESTSLMRGEPGTDCELTILRDAIDKPFKVVITRAVIKLKTVKWQLFEHPEKSDHKYALLRISSFNGDTAREAVQAVKEIKKSNARGLIIDLRSNPGGLLSGAVQIAGLFLPAQSLVVYTKGRIPASNVQYKTRINPILPNIPMAVLINNGSASASEILAGALMDHNRAVVIGGKSFGKGSVQHIFPLFDGSSIVMTVAKYFTPKGLCIHETGINPDVNIVMPSNAELKRINNQNSFWDKLNKKKTGLSKKSDESKNESKDDSKDDPEKGKPEKDNSKKDSKKDDPEKSIKTDNNKSTKRKTGKLEMDYQIKRAVEILKIIH